MFAPLTGFALKLAPKASAVCPRGSYSAFLSVRVLICQMGRGFVLGGWLWGTERETLTAQHWVATQGC